MKIGNLELSDWIVETGGYGRSRYQVIHYPTGICHGSQLVYLHFSSSDKNIVKHIRFYDFLYFCDEIYNPTNKELKLPIDEAIISVDNFLLKVAKLKAFM